MPDRMWVARHEPPDWTDRLLVRVFLIAVCAGTSLFGSVLTLDAFLPLWHGSSSLDRMPAVLAGGIGLFLAVGGALSIGGSLWPHARRDRAWRMDQLGFLLMAGGLAAYAVTVLSAYPKSVFSWGVPLNIALAYLAQFVVSKMQEVETRRRVRLLQQTTDNETRRRAIALRDRGPRG